MDREERLVTLLLQSTIDMLEMELSKTSKDQKEPEPEPESSSHMIRESAIVDEIHGRTGINRLIVAKVISEFFEVLKTAPEGICIARQAGKEE